MKNDQTKLPEWRWSMALYWWANCGQDAWGSNEDTLCERVEFSRPGTFQTSSFRTNINETSAVRLAEEKTGKPFNTRMKWHILWFSEQIRPPNLCLATPYSAKQLLYTSFDSIGYTLWQQPPKVWYSSVKIKELWRAVGDAASFIHFVREIDNDCENGTPGTCQTFSFGTNANENGAIRFAETRREE